MTEPQPELLETILRQCGASKPQPWYPRPFAEAMGIPRDTVDAALDRLRMRGLVQLTEWVRDHGQGYALTPDGERVLQDGRLLAQVRAGKVPAARPPAEDAPRSRSGRLTPYERGEIIRAALTQQTPPVATGVIIALNIAVFLAGIALAMQRHVPLNQFIWGSDLVILEQTGAVSIVDILHGEWWRLLTSCFVHVGLLHLGVNMYALYNIGPLMERILGRWRYALLYLVAGFGGSCIGVIGQYNVAGASGAICGLLGALAAWAYLNRQFLPPPVLASIQRYVLVNGFLIAVISFFGAKYISWSGHLGGAVFGLVGGALLNAQRFGSPVVRLVGLLGLVALPIAGIGSILYGERSLPRLEAIRDRDDRIQENREIDRFNDEVMKQFVELRNKAWDAYRTQFVPLFSQNPKRRDPADVKKALAALEQGRSQLKEAGEVMTRGGPYHSPRVVKVQQVGQEWVAEMVKLFDMAQRCLRDENWHEKDDQQLQEQMEREAQARQRWQAVLEAP
jgi:membrane associated rhomboid family serine protease